MTQGAGRRGRGRMPRTRRRRMVPQSYIPGTFSTVINAVGDLMEERERHTLTARHSVRLIRQYRKERDTPPRPHQKRP